MIKVLLIKLGMHVVNQWTRSFVRGMSVKDLQHILRDPPTEIKIDNMNQMVHIRMTMTIHNR